MKAVERMETNNKKLKQYFLEQLSPQEVEEIELQLMSDADFSVELETAETEIMEDYLENLLTKDETKLFETNYLNSVERNKKLQFLKSLKQFAQKKVQNLEIKDSSPGFFETIKTMFSSHWLPVGVVLIIITLILGGIWKSFSPSGTVNPEIVALNQRDFSNLKEFKDFTNISLISGNLRSSDGQSSFNSNDLRENILLRLALPPNTALESTYNVNLLQDRKILFNLNKARIYGSPTSQEFRMILPAKILKIGEYQIELQKESSPESKIIYNFTVR